MRFVVSIVAAFLVLSGCSNVKNDQSPSAEIVGDWEIAESHIYVIDASTGEINGRAYLFLMTIGTDTLMNATIHIFNVDDPIEPVEVASLETPIEMMFPLGGLVLSETELYVALTGSDEATLWVLDVSDPESPSEITQINTTYAVWRPCVSGNYLAVASAMRGPIAFFDISRPAQPQWLGDLELAPIPGNVTNWRSSYVGSMFYVVDRNGLAIADVSSPALPQEVGFYTNPDWEGAETSVIYSTAEYATLEEMFEDMYSSGSFLDVAVSNRYAYIAASDYGLIVLDMGNPKSVEEVARLEIPGKAIHVLSKGDLVYIMGVNLPGDSSTGSFLYSVHIVDVSDPLAPALANSIEVITALPPSQSLVILGDYIYFLNYQAVYVIDIYGGHR